MEWEVSLVAWEVLDWAVVAAPAAEEATSRMCRKGNTTCKRFAAQRILRSSRSIARMKSCQR